MFDTNIFISALIFGGLPFRLITLGIEGRFQILTSPILLDELDEKLRSKFNISALQADQTRSDLESFCEVVSTFRSLAIVKEDPDDDRVLECAIDGRADYIVSGDRHLLKLGAFRGITILTVRQFMESLSPTT